MKLAFYQANWFYGPWGVIVTLLGAVRSRLGIRQEKVAEKDRIRFLEERLQLMELSTQQLQVANQNLQRLSRLDGLTGIANRRHFEEVLDTEWRRASRAGTALSLIMIDADFFKAFNDAYGHQRGDECLMLLASIFGNAVNRPGDLAARYGGEEFMILLPGTSAQGAVELAEAIRARVEATQIWHEGSPAEEVVTISLGVVTSYPVRGLSPGGLIAAVDEALYRAKQEGRNRVIMSEPPTYDNYGSDHLSLFPLVHKERGLKRRPTTSES
jgi:diguanylate cyclase (GGDEF)-like protein